MRRYAIFLVLLILLTSAILFAGCFGQIKVGKPEIKGVTHHWGEINDKTTEILTDVVVYNPNPIPIPIKRIQVDVYMNGIKMGEGENIGPAELKPSEDTTIRLSTKIDNSKIPEWWVSHIKNGENTDFALKGKIVFDLKIMDFNWPFEQNYKLHTDFLKEMNLNNVPFTVGPIQLYASVKSKWGSVTEKKTEIIHEITFRNPNSFPIPVTKIDYGIWMNNIRIGEGSSANPALLTPNGYTKLTFKTEIDNSKLVEWWPTHLKRGEKSVIKVKITPVIKVFGQKFSFTLLETENEFKTNLLGQL